MLIYSLLVFQENIEIIRKDIKTVVGSGKPVVNNTVKVTPQLVKKTREEVSYVVTTMVYSSHKSFEGSEYQQAYLIRLKALLNSTQNTILIELSEPLVPSTVTIFLFPVPAGEKKNIHLS